MPKDFKPVEIEGKPLSDTVIEDRDYDVTVHCFIPKREYDKLIQLKGNGPLPDFVEKIIKNYIWEVETNAGQIKIQ